MVRRVAKIYKKMVNNENINIKDIGILNKIDKKKNDFMNSLINDDDETLSLDDFNAQVMSRNKEGVLKELNNFIEEINTPILLNKVLNGLIQSGHNLTYNYLNSKGNLKEFRTYLIKSNSKIKSGYIVKSVLSNNKLYLMKMFKGGKNESN